jgi:Uma2 family endonuclease
MPCFNHLKEKAMNNRNFTIIRDSTDWYTNLCEGCGRRGHNVFKIRVGASPINKRPRLIWMCRECLADIWREVKRVGILV